MEDLINIIASNVEIKDFSINIDSVNSTIEITNKIETQSIIIQSNDDGFWVRLREPHTGYFCESKDEFKLSIEALMKNRIEVCVGSKEDKWIETIIVPTHNHDEMKSDLDYQIYYWPYPTKY